MLILALLVNLNVYALEVVKQVYNKKIELKIIRAIPDEFDTYLLTNHNSREMTLVCKNNLVYDNNPKAMIEYRNYYNVVAGYFTLENNDVCRDMGQFIEKTFYGIDEERPFIITLDTLSMKVSKIVYPKLDIFNDQGEIRDLLPKPRIVITTPVKKRGKKMPKVQLY